MAIVKKLLKPMVLIPVVVALLLLGGTAYVLLAPETWWKPFYVRLEMEGTPTPDPAAAAAMPQPQGMPAQPAAAMPQAMPVGNYIQSGKPAGIMYELNPKVVNLAEPGGFRYLQVSITLELWPLVDNYYMLQGEEKDLAIDKFRETMNSWQPVIDDILTTTLSSKTFGDISTIDGKEALKQELMSSINELLGYDGVINVYFTNFVVQ